MSNSIEKVEVTNDVRGFMVYDVLHQALKEYIEAGDGFHAVSVFDEDVYTDSLLIDSSVNSMVRLLATGFGLTHADEALAIAKAMQRDGVRKKTMRFRSRHPLFANGSPLYQNICLISGMIHFEIPILPYFTGQELLVEMNDSLHIDIERMSVDETKRSRKN